MNTSGIRSSSFFHQARELATESKLMMSDYLLLFSVVLVLAYLVSPFARELQGHPITKHLPFAFFLLGGFATLIGNRLFNTANHKTVSVRWQITSLGLPLWLLGVWIAIGGLYARNSLGESNTFMMVGCYMLASLLVAKVVLVAANREKIITGFFTISCFFAAVMILQMIVVVCGFPILSDNYHELEGFIVPLAVYLAMRPMKNKHWQGFLVFFFLVSGLLFRKNTGYIVMSITAAYLWIVLWRFRFKESAGFRKITIAWVVLLVLVGVALFIYKSTVVQMLPSGNPQYRLITYEIAWSKFLSSPLWGTAFTGSATEKFMAFDVGLGDNNLPSHSDILDLAANGGLVALALWVWSYIRIGTSAFKFALKTNVNTNMQAATHAAACASFSLIFVYAFNPIMMQPIKALLLWWYLGLLLGITVYYKQLHKHTTDKS